MKIRVTTCYNHPQRETTQRCERCSTVYCDECLTEYKGRNLCANCITEVEEAERLRAEAKRPFWQKLNREEILSNLIWVGGAFAVVAIIAGIMVFFISRQTLSDEDYARIAMATRMQMGAPVNVLSLGWKTQIVSVTSEQPDYLARRVIDGGASPDLPGWRSTTATFPQEMIFELHDPYKPAVVNKAVFTTVSDAAKDTWAKEVEVQSADSLQGPWKTLGTWTLKQVEDPQEFNFDQVTLNGYVKLRILSNQGSHDYTSLGEFELQLQNR